MKLKDPAVPSGIALAFLFLLLIGMTVFWLVSRDQPYHCPSQNISIPRVLPSKTDTGATSSLSDDLVHGQSGDLVMIPQRND